MSMANASTTMKAPTRTVADLANRSVVVPDRREDTEPVLPEQKAADEVQPPADEKKRRLRARRRSRPI